MTKIGIATCFLDNYGACLQAFALQSHIKKLGFETDILQYLEPLGYDNNRKIIRRIAVNSLSRWVRSLLSSDNRRKYLFRKRCQDFRKKYLVFSKKLYSLDEVKKISDNYDSFVCGSDQIWNPEHFGTLNKVYYLDFAGRKKRIAYAPSIGLPDLEEKYCKEFSQLIGKFHCLSVREKTGRDLIRKYAGKDAKVVLDPTLLFSGGEWKAIISQTNDQNSSLPRKGSNYILCYLFGNKELYYGFIDYARRLMGADVYIIPFQDSHLTKGYRIIENAGPLDFVRLISDAQLVITDSFHATAFSINLNVPFYTLLRNDHNEKNNMNSRVEDILGLTHLSSRLWTNSSDYSSFSRDVDWTVSNSILEEKRKEDLAFLKKALEE